MALLFTNNGTRLLSPNLPLEVNKRPLRRRSMRHNIAPTDTPTNSTMTPIPNDSFRKLDCIIVNSPSTPRKEAVEVVLEQADVVAKGHKDKLASSRSNRFPMGLASFHRISTTTRAKSSTKSSQIVPTPTPVWRSPPPLAKAKNSTVSWPHEDLEFSPWPPALWTIDDAVDAELMLTYKSPGKFAQLLETTLKHVQDRAGSSPPTNTWSEPSASTMNVRGKNYSNDGVKMPSEPSLFSVLGVDSFVNGDRHEDFDPSSGTDSFLRRWKEACEEFGLARPPFLLTINFIVPWGNFQSYLIRPDADDGPFCSRYIDRPSETSWREFLEGSTEYRNEHFKLIPRVCAGPWMIKKLVGSTPARIGTKVPVSYRGSAAENYLEIIIDVTKGPALGNNIANTVVGKADAVTVDLGFVIEAQEDEQMLGLIRFHHLNMKTAPSHSQWNEEVVG